MSFKIGDAKIIVEAYVPSPDVIASAYGAAAILKELERLSSRIKVLEAVRDAGRSLVLAQPDNADERFKAFLEALEEAVRSGET